MKRTFISFPILLGFLLLGVLSACSPPSRLAAVPQDQEADVTVLGGLHDARFWGDEVTPQMVRNGLEAYQREREYATAQGRPGPLPPADYLAISGGGENGAFGAGLLIGWTATGTRPEFKIVTGISTGALTAPFAFLGPAHDEQLREIYTEITPDQVLEKRWVITGILNDAMATNAPLFKTIQRYVTPQLLAEIAEAHRHGRILLIGTTDLDAGRPVIWDIGRIAESGRQGALELVQKILLASAAIPVAFPPTMIDVEVNGKPYQEMDVDGGGSAQVFVYPPALQINRYGITRKRHLYIIRNARLDPQWANVTRQTLSIADRATTSLIQSQGVGDLYRIYSVSQRDQVDFNLAYMPATFNVPLRYSFDPDYMKALYHVGYELGKDGYHWAKVPPGFGAIDPHAGIPKEQSELPPSSNGSAKP
jgi:hypothetical protein